jgi:uncharacterized membrane-anchored protein YjiN (DUF445 family)
MLMNDKTYNEEKEKIRRFRWEMFDEIDAAAWRVMDDVQKVIEAAMPQVKEIVKREVAALKAFIEGAPFDDPDLKNALNESLDNLTNTVEIFIIASVRRAVRKTFETLKDDVDEKAKTALEGLDFLIAVR